MPARLVHRIKDGLDSPLFGTQAVNGNEPSCEFIAGPNCDRCQM